MNGYAILKLPTYSKQIFCENRKCQMEHVKTYYSYEHMKDDGWLFISARTTRTNEFRIPEKASPFNTDMMVECYCPKCAEEIKQ